MRYGCDDDGVIDPDNVERPWAEVLHLDIKPSNIVLGELNLGDAHSTQHKWPKILVTDFGISAEIQAEFSNPKDYAGRGTPGYKAPEQFRQINRDRIAYPEQQLTSKTNVWGVGAVLYDLCNPSSIDGDYASGGPCWREESGKKRRRHIHVELGNRFPGDNLDPDELEWRKIPAKRETGHQGPEEEKHVYSEALRALIAQCLEYFPDNRPTIERLLVDIRINRDKFDDLDTAFEDMGEEEVSLAGESIFRLDSMDDVFCPINEAYEPESESDAIDEGEKEAVVDG